MGIRRGELSRYFGMGMGGAGENAGAGTNYRRFDNTPGIRKQRATELFNERYAPALSSVQDFLSDADLSVPQNVAARIKLLAMQLNKANTEPYYRFHRSNEELNRTMRIIVAGLWYVKQQRRSAAGPVQLPTDGEPFGTNLWNYPAQGVVPAKMFAAQMGIVRVIASLEDLCVGMKAERDRFAAIKGEEIEEGVVDDVDAEGLSPKSLYTKLGWKKDMLDDVEPLYEYFSKVRNCVVHRSGRASQDLKRYSTNSQLLACVDGWKGPRNRRIPALSIISVGNELALLPRHAVLASEVCRRIAVDSNNKLIEYLGEDGIVCMAAYHSLLSERPIITDARNTAQAVLNYLITSRYRVRLRNRDEAVQMLSRMGRWKPYLRKFERLRAKGLSV